ncbi:MAG: HAMP domain-containing protein [Chitinivibrionales bacterium]|nr:HAMP domain-containing protein [Chitinivibrionales bacterium]
MERSSGRKPVGNFFIKKSLQLSLTLKIVFAVIFATLISCGSIVLAYYIQHKSVLFYQLEQSGDLSKESIFHIILPSLIISIGVNIIVAIFVGLYASRKYAVPVYKLEQWASLLRNGKLHTRLRFREQNELKELSNHFNTLVDELRDKFIMARKALENTSDEATAKRAREILNSLDFALQETVSETKT